MIKMKKRTILHVALPFCLFLCGFFWARAGYGMWLMDAPEPEHVVSVEVYAHGTFTDDKVMTAVLTDPSISKWPVALCGTCGTAPSAAESALLSRKSASLLPWMTALRM